jgi:hypothetical protein
VVGLALTAVGAITGATLLVLDGAQTAKKKKARARQVRPHVLRVGGRGGTVVGMQAKF